MSELLDLLAKAFSDIDIDAEDEVESNIDILGFMIEYLTKAVQDNGISLPEIIEGVRNKDGPKVYAIYQEEFKALLGKIKDKFNEVDDKINKANKAVGLEKEEQSKLNKLVAGNHESPFD